VFLRNGWYQENYAGTIAQATQLGGIVGSAGEGRVGAAARADYAAAAAAVLAGEGHEGKAYELAGDEPFTMAELAAEVSRQTGENIGYRNLPVDEYTKVLVAAGVPQPYAEILADSDLGLARGELASDSGDLRRLIGRPTTALADAVAAALKG
jgi:NAD(P)H dehydrogenase (quinone)